MSGTMFDMAAYAKCWMEPRTRARSTSLNLTAITLNKHDIEFLVSWFCSWAVYRVSSLVHVSSACYHSHLALHLPFLLVFSQNASAFACPPHRVAAGLLPVVHHSGTHPSLWIHGYSTATRLTVRPHRPTHEVFLTAKINLRPHWVTVDFYGHGQSEKSPSPLVLCGGLFLPLHSVYSLLSNQRL